MPAHIIRAYNAKLDVAEGERAIIATINTNTIDRYRTVIDPKGGRLDNYRRNPVVLLNHDESQPVGRNQWIKLKEGRLVAKTKFMDATLSEQADKTFRMYQEGFMYGFSISFDPVEYGPPTVEEIRARPELAECRCIYRVWDLMEYSCVAVPANPEAIAEAVSRGFMLAEWAEPKPAAAAPALPPLRGRTMDQVFAAMKRQMSPESLKAMRSQALQDAIDLARGRV